MKNLTFEETDLFALVKITGPLYDNENFKINFESLWMPTEIDKYEYEVFVCDRDGYKNLIEYLNREIGPQKYKIELL